jgi:hypothetical protein
VGTGNGFKTARGDASQADTPSRPPASSDSRSGKSKVIEFRGRVNGVPTDPIDPAPLTNPSRRPCQFVLDSHVDEILLLARRGRDYRNIARTFGVSALDIWKIVTDALQQSRRAA